MRYDNLRAFAKHIESASPNHLMMMYLLISKNSRDLTEAAQIIIKSIFPEEKYSKLEVCFFSTEDTEINVLLNEINTISFFAKKRVIVLQHTEKLNKAHLQLLQTYFDQPNPQVHLLLMAESISKASEFYKKAEKQGVILDIAEEKAWQKEKTVQLWLREKICREGWQIEPVAVEALIKQIGTEQDLLEQEVNKLYCYLGEKGTVTLQDVQAVCSVVSVDTIWELGEAIFSFNTSRALKNIKSLLNDQAALIGLLRQLRTQFQTLLQISSILASGKGKEEITHCYRYLTGNILNKKIQEAQKYGIDNLKRGLLEIDNTELKAKNGMGDQELLAEVLIVQLTKNNDKY